MEYCVSITHDEINSTYFIVDCLRGLGMANGQIFNISINFCCSSYSTVTLLSMWCSALLLQTAYLHAKPVTWFCLLSI